MVIPFIHFYIPSCVQAGQVKIAILMDFFTSNVNLSIFTTFTGKVYVGNSVMVYIDNAYRHHQLVIISLT